MSHLCYFICELEITSYARSSQNNPHAKFALPRSDESRLQGAEYIRRVLSISYVCQAPRLPCLYIRNPLGIGPGLGEVPRTPLLCTWVNKDWRRVHVCTVGLRCAGGTTPSCRRRGGSCVVCSRRGGAGTLRSSSPSATYPLSPATLASARTPRPGPPPHGR